MLDGVITRRSAAVTQEVALATACSGIYGMLPLRIHIVHNFARVDKTPFCNAVHVNILNAFIPMQCSAAFPCESHVIFVSLMCRSL